VRCGARGRALCLPLGRTLLTHTLWPAGTNIQTGEEVAIKLVRELSEQALQRPAGQALLCMDTHSALCSVGKRKDQAPAAAV
jgi:hypothetical protein